MATTGEDAYTGWCIAEDSESNRRKNQAILEKVDDKDSIKELEKAAEDAQRFTEELKRAIEKRRSTLSALRGLANELDSMKEGVDIARVTGSSVAVAGGAMAITGGILSVLTFGLASPLIGVGLTTAVAGGVTSGGAGIAEAVISKDKMKEAQERLDEDKRAMSRFDATYAHLRRVVAVLSRSSPHLGSQDEILCSLLVANKFSASKSDVNRPFAFSATVCALVCVGCVAITVAKTAGKQSAKVAGKIGPKIAARLAPKMAGVIAKGAVESAGNVARAVLRGAVTVAVPVIFAFDIYELVDASISINNGSKSAAAKTLRDIVRGYEEQLKEMETFLSEQSSLANDLELMLKKQFQNLLERIFSKAKNKAKDKEKNVSDEDVAEVWRYIKISGWSVAWHRAFLSRVIDRDAFVLAISRIIKFLIPFMKEYAERRREEETVVDLTFLAHGKVSNPLLPCALNYINGNVMSVKLYVPWGCNLAATAAYGIATRMISINNVWYTSTGRVVPAIPSGWNTLPQDFTLIPEVVFSPFTKDEGVYDWLVYLNSVIQGTVQGLVIPYFQPPGAADLPEVPLWALCNAVALIGWIFNVRFKIHVASCLFPSDKTICTDLIYPPDYTVNCSQYCAVPILPDNPISMEMMYEVPSHLQSAFGALNIALGSNRSSSKFRKQENN